MVFFLILYYYTIFVICDNGHGRDRGVGRDGRRNGSVVVAVVVTKTVAFAVGSHDKSYCHK